MRTHSRTAPLWNIGHDLHHPKYQLATIPMRICYFQILHRYRFTNYYGVSWRILCWKYHQRSSETLFETFYIENYQEFFNWGEPCHMVHMIWSITILKTDRNFILDISTLRVKEVQGTLQHKLIWNKLPQITSLAN